jgi:hypothetical protein
LIIGVVTWCGPVRASELDAASPEELIEVLKANVYLTGDIVKRMEAGPTARWRLIGAWP